MQSNKPLVIVALVVASGSSFAAGCLSGGAVGAVGGHVAGHHAIAGAVVGCAVGHHMKVKQGSQGRCRCGSTASCRGKRSRPLS